MLLHCGETIPQLLAQLRQAQERLIRVAANAPDLEAVAGLRGDGTPSTVRQRLELLANHWEAHLQALREAS